MAPVPKRAVAESVTSYLSQVFALPEHKEENSKIFALEFHIDVPYLSLGHFALGYFVIYVDGVMFGIRESNNTLLARSFDEIQRRIRFRGKHRFPDIENLDALQIAETYCSAIYREDGQSRMYFGLSPVEYWKALIANRIIWAPDGDEAFDDGSHVLQFDLDNEFRLIAFKNEPSKEDILKSVRETRMPADVFYDLLEQFSEALLATRNFALSKQQPSP